MLFSFERADLSKKSHSAVAIARRSHLFPCRTQQLSFVTPRVVGGSPPVRVGSCRALDFYSGIAQLVEHLTVNQGVDGSSPPAGVFNSVIALL